VSYSPHCEQVPACLEGFWLRPSRDHVIIVYVPMASKAANGAAGPARASASTRTSSMLYAA